MSSAPWSNQDFSFSGDLIASTPSWRLLRATEWQTGDAFAIKVVNLGSAIVRRELAQLRREVDVQWRCHHERVAAIQGFWWSLRQPTPELCIVQDHGEAVLPCFTGVEGRWASEQVRGDADDVARLYVRDLAVAVHNCHVSCGVVHRGVRLSNARLLADGHLHLAGFEHATPETDEGELREFRGAPDFVSPEMARSATAPWRARPEFADYAAQPPRSHGRPTDVWGLGTVAYQLFFGAGPFSDAEATSATNFVGFGRAIIESRPFLPDWLSAKARDFMKVTLNKNAAQRPTIGQVLGHPWLQEVPPPKEASAAAPRERRVVDVAPQPAPAGFDAAARIAGVSLPELHTLCASIGAPQRTTAEQPRPASPPREDSAMQGCEDAPPRNGRSQARERASPNDKAGSPIVAGAAARAGRQARMAAPRSPVMARQRSPQQSAAFASRSPRFASPAGSFGDASPSGRPAPVAFSWPNEF